MGLFIVIRHFPEYGSTTSPDRGHAVKIQIHALMFACALGAATPTIHAQKQDCTPPQADSKMPPEQQEAAADGYRIACESVKAYKKRAAEQKSARD